MSKQKGRKILIENKPEDEKSNQENKVKESDLSQRGQLDYSSERLCILIVAMETHFLALFMSNVDMLLALASGILADMTQQRLEICLHFGEQGYLIEVLLTSAPCISYLFLLAHVSVRLKTSGPLSSFTRIFQTIKVNS